MRPHVRLLILRTRNMLGALIVSCVVLLAVAFSVVRLLLPLASDYRLSLEQLASESLGVPVAIAQIDTDWSWFRPRIKLSNVTLGDPALEQSIMAEQVILGINPFTSVVNRKIEVDDITIVGTNPVVGRDERGRFFVQGLFFTWITNTEAPIALKVTKVVLN